MARVFEEFPEASGMSSSTMYESFAIHSYPAEGACFEIFLENKILGKFKLCSGEMSRSTITILIWEVKGVFTE